MLRLLIDDITVDRIRGRHQAVLHVRWKGGVCEDLPVELPQPMADRVRYPKPIVDRVRKLAHELTDDQVAAGLNEAGLLSAKCHCKVAPRFWPHCRGWGMTYALWTPQTMTGLPN